MSTTTTTAAMSTTTTAAITTTTTTTTNVMQPRHQHHHQQQQPPPHTATSCCSHINSHNQVRGDRTGSSHSGAEEYPREKTQNNPRWYTHLSQLTESIPPPDTYKSEIGSPSTVRQVHTGAYDSLLAPGKTDYTACYPRRTTTYILHVVSITTHTHDRRKSIGKKKQRKEEKTKEGKGKKIKERKGKKIKERKQKRRKRKKKRKRKGKKRKDKKSKIIQDKKRKQGKAKMKKKVILADPRN